MATALDVLVWAPLLSAAIWYGVVFYQVRRERYRTWTEVFFVALLASAGTYALSDTVFFNAPTAEGARAAAVASLYSVTFIAFFLFLYGVALEGRFRRRLLGVAIPLGAL